MQYSQVIGNFQFPTNSVVTSSFNNNKKHPVLITPLLQPTCMSCLMLACVKCRVKQSFLSVCWSVSLSVCPSISLSVCSVSLSLSVCQSVLLSVCQSVGLSVCRSVGMATTFVSLITTH